MNRKTGFLFLIFIFITGIYSYSQYIPKGINYQAVARDERGYELKNKQLEVRISIIPLDPSGTPEYTESHSIITDKYGLFNILIGQGSYVSGGSSQFSDIDWGSGVHFLKVEVNFGTGLKLMGTTQFLAVPYALYAGSAANTPDAKDQQKLSYDPLIKELSLENGGKADLSGLYEDPDSDPNNEIQDLSYANHVLSLSKANSVTINTDDADPDPKNEIQNLDLKGYQLSISGGNTVTLTDLFEDADHDSINEIQDLHLDEMSNILTITNNPVANPVYLQKFMDNTDNQLLYTAIDSLGILRGNKIPMDISKTNEIQTLRKSTSGDSILLSLNGGFVIDKFDDADNNPQNELQSVRLIGDNLSLTNDPNAAEVSLNKYFDNTDSQTLSVNGYNLSITGGDTVNLRPGIIAFRAISTGSPIMLSAGASTILVFADEKIDLGNGYNNLNGRFIVPSGGEGLYNFNLVYKLITGQSLDIQLNGSLYEQVLSTESFPFIMYLNDGDYVEIVLRSSVNSFPQAGVLSGFRVH